ncbi:MAG: ribonuclease HII [Epulopiscium sp. Nuni2H_MBin003]|nr:MAG: ribonuclease HII [Epulopiscium sp. Nuni2H_MBin003]
MTKQERILRDTKHMSLMLDMDKTFQAGHKVVVGIDEAGRGPLAGDVFAAAVILPADISLIGLKDSKKLSAKRRDELFLEINNLALAIGIGRVSAAEIDEINILNATFKAMQMALDNIKINYDVILIDGNQTIPNISCEQFAIVAGDNKSAAISAASIIAKVSRDRYMQTLNYHGFNFAKHKGYGTKEHYLEIDQLGITDIHRKSFLTKVLH